MRSRLENNTYKFGWHTVAILFLGKTQLCLLKTGLEFTDET